MSGHSSSQNSSAGPYPKEAQVALPGADGLEWHKVTVIGKKGRSEYRVMSHEPLRIRPDHIVSPGKVFIVPKYALEFAS